MKAKELLTYLLTSATLFLIVNVAKAAPSVPSSAMEVPTKTDRLVDSLLNIPTLAIAGLLGALLVSALAWLRTDGVREVGIQLVFGAYLSATGIPVGIAFALINSTSDPASYLEMATVQLLLPLFGVMFALLSSSALYRLTEPRRSDRR